MLRPSIVHPGSVRLVDRTSEYMSGPERASVIVFRFTLTVHVIPVVLLDLGEQYVSCVPFYIFICMLAIANDKRILLLQIFHFNVIKWYE